VAPAVRVDFRRIKPPAAQWGLEVTVVLVAMLVRGPMVWMVQPV
jgi:hypothetical protein